MTQKPRQFISHQVEENNCKAAGKNTKERNGRKGKERGKSALKAVNENPVCLLHNPQGASLQRV